ncbi:MAG: hypothetical protein ACJA1A_001544 [Saprospiraceae bacterium]|jgi:uncharacterized protein (DUF302 family)|tara:strand:- start:543 stop:1451 length:909 start_codon:yes stop_codon:yes gene_type:complete
MKKLFRTASLLFITTIGLITCGEDNSNSSDNIIDGLATASTEIAGSEVYSAIISTLESIEAISILSEVDHINSASTVEMTLPYTHVVLFGNPSLGTPLMQENILTGLDLPQKILVTENLDGSTDISFNDPSYLKGRYKLVNDTLLAKIRTALTNIVGSSDGKVTLKTTSKISKHEGIISTTSNNAFEETYTAIKTAISNNDKLKVTAELNHKMNAASVNMELANSKLIIFGNPDLGSPLMIKNQKLGLELPQKMLIYERNGQVMISYNDPAFLLNRFNIEGESEIASKISDALASIAAAGSN